MTTFSDSARAFIDSTLEVASRRDAWLAFEKVGLPTTSDEVWRYAPLSDFSLDAYEVGLTRPNVSLDDFGRRLVEAGGVWIQLSDGHVSTQGGDVPGVHVSTLHTPSSLSGDSLNEHYESDAFALLAGALAPQTLLVDVDPGTQVTEPIVIASSIGTGAAFTKVNVRLGRGAQATVIEYLGGGRDSLVVPLSEYFVGEGATLRTVSYQRLDSSAWHVARTTAFIERDAHVFQSVVGLGSGYNRSRNDAELRGPGSSNELRTTYLGVKQQIHDFRTRQYHVGPRTTSTLLSKGAVAGSSRSVYTGLIEIEKGAKGTDARQTNHNLLLSGSAHADSVPNLEIRENDVACAHASSVGPLDELQSWYLESRGIARHDAQRLLIRGFYIEMLDALPQSISALVIGDVVSRLDALLDEGPQ